MHRFEYGLSLIAQYVDSGMLVVSNLNYASERTVYFQRLSVICTDLVLFYAIYTFARARAPWLPNDHKHSRITLVRHTSCSCGGLLWTNCMSLMD